MLYVHPKSKQQALFIKKYVSEHARHEEYSKFKNLASKRGREAESTVKDDEHQSKYA